MTVAVLESQGVSTRALRGKRSVRRAAAADLEADSGDEKEGRVKEEPPVTAEERAIAFGRLTAQISKAERRWLERDLKGSSAERTYLSIRSAAPTSARPTARPGTSPLCVKPESETCRHVLF